MHICFSTIDYHQKNKGGGIASYLDAISPALVRAGHKVTIVGPGSKKESFINDQGVRVILLPLGKLHWYLYRLKFPSIIYLLIREWEWSRTLYNTIIHEHANNPFDVIESHENGLFYLVMKKRYLPPIIVRLHGSRFVFKLFSGQKPSIGEKVLHSLEIKLLRKAVGVTAPSLFQCSLYTKWSNRSIHFIPNPIHCKFLEEVDPAEQKCKEVFVGKRILLYTGRIEFTKGILILIDALGELVKRRTDVLLLVAGSMHNSISKKKLDESIKNAGVKDYLKLLGHVPFESLKQLYLDATVFIMPSYYETFGISVIEAMANGLPVVTTDAGALPELVENGVNGRVVVPGDARELSNAIDSLLKMNDDQLREIGKRNKKKIQQNFLPDLIAARMLAYVNNDFH